MFKKIILPISSEFYSQHVLQRAVMLAQSFSSTINLIYIIEEKTLDQTEKTVNSYLTDFDKEETKKEIIRRHINVAESIIFEDAKQLFDQYHIPYTAEVIKGEFSEVVKGQIIAHHHDLVIMGFEKECLLHYRLFDEVNIPVWVESGNTQQSILAVCSNLAPNKKVPSISQQLAKILGWDLKMIYIVDTQDAVSVDGNGVRSEKKSEHELSTQGHHFIYEMEKKGLPMKLYTGSLEKEIRRVADESGTGLVILGREQKRKSMFGMSSKSVKKKVAENCQYSYLFVK